MVSGFLDRAEKIFEQLVEEPDYKEAALQQLVTIYQQTREWEKAIHYANQLAKMGNQRSRMRTNIAHFWCEIAMLDQADGNTNKAIQHFKKHFPKIQNVFEQVFRSAGFTWSQKTTNKPLSI